MSCDEGRRKDSMLIRCAMIATEYCQEKRSDAQGLGKPAFTGATCQSEKQPQIGELVSSILAACDLLSDYHCKARKPSARVFSFPGVAPCFGNTLTIAYYLHKVNPYGTSKREVLGFM